jgi:hypothetical protein
MTKTDDFLAASDGHTILALEAMRTRALVERDFSTLAALLSDDLVYTHSSGVVQDKQGFMEYATSSLRCLAVEWRGEYVQCFDNLAVLSGYMLTTMQPAAPVAPVSVDAHVLQVWRRERAAWTMLAFQATRLPVPNLPGQAA